MGANPLTYMGLAGVGDLIATCTSKNSRNRALGEFIGRGGTLDGWRAQTNMVAEGAYACIAVEELGKRLGIEMPLTRQVRAVLYEGLSLADGEDALLGREPSEELYGLRPVDE
jgi:glycerol-3-phosphate dehydrogenase (NAD(P)+)